MDPVRSCIACRDHVALSDLRNAEILLHLVERDGQVIPDPQHRLGGRGAWLHPQCWEKAKTRRSFDRAFKSTKALSLEELEKFFNNLHEEHK
jgi:hypothetical protein